MLETNYRILIVSDNPDDQAQYQQLLSHELGDAIHFQIASSAETAFNFLKNESFNCILLGDHLPDMKSLEFLSRVEPQLRSEHIPLLMLVAKNDETTILEALNMGAEYLSKDLISQGCLYHATINVIEKSELKKEIDLLSKKITRLAYHDHLTGIANRLQFEELLVKSLSRAKRFKRHVGLLLLDLDHFKEVNDTLGHQAGDTLLKEVTARFKKILRETDTIARLGGDEFAVILDEIAEPASAAFSAKRLLQQLKSPILLEGQPILISTSIGIACYPDAGSTLNELYRHADIALYRAKDLGRNNYQFFSDDLQKRASEQLTLEQALQHALPNHEFTLYFQPILSLGDKKITGVEALLRWEHPTLGNIAPNVLLPIAESNGLIIPIGEWVIKTALAQFHEWQQLGFKTLSLSVNLSPIQLSKTSWLDLLHRLCKQYQINPALLTFELAETSLLKDIPSAQTTLSELKKLGCQIYIDDFGKGYSSLTLLHQLPISGIKIDRSFIAGIPENKQNENMILAILAFAEKLNLEVIAEGIETPEQVAFLKQHHSQHGQGFYLAKPMNVEETTCLLMQDRDNG